MRGLISAMLGVEGVRAGAGALRQRAVMTGEQVRWGLENLNLDQGKLDAMGFAGVMRPVQTSAPTTWARRGSHRHGMAASGRSARLVSGRRQGGGRWCSRAALSTPPRRICSAVPRSSARSKLKTRQVETPRLRCRAVREAFSKRIEHERTQSGLPQRQQHRGHLQPRHPGGRACRLSVQEGSIVACSAATAPARRPRCARSATPQKGERAR